MKQDKLIKLENKINNDYKNIAGITVLKDGKIEYENYFNGCNSESTVHVYSVTSRWKKLNLPYGYLWWLDNDKEHIFSAIGDGGNVIYVNTDKNIVVSIASLFEPNVTDRIEFIKEYIEAIFL